LVGVSADAPSFETPVKTGLRDFKAGQARVGDHAGAGNSLPKTPIKCPAGPTFATQTVHVPSPLPVVATEGYHGRMFSLFHPITEKWFRTHLGEPTDPQRRGWPEIAAGRHTLIAAPTGSGKTLTAFLCCIDRLLRDWLDGQLRDGVRVLYVSPLKALSNDIHRNLETPLAQIREVAVENGYEAPPIRAAVRTGDTPASQRQKMLRNPPHIFVTTPESLYLLLTSEKGRACLRNVRTVIVDEIHALARDKRGSHLTLSLERLAQLCETPPARIGLSATQRPIHDIARFLVGAGNVDDGGNVNCAIVDVGHVRELDLALEVPPTEMSAVCSHEQWEESYERLVELIQSHRSTLVFVNTRRLAERVSHRLAEMLGDDAVASHHGSLSRDLRHSAEQRLKSGHLKAIVATASLEMGIDVGFIDLVCQIGSPRSITTFLQRVGRSGHSLGVVPKGRLFPLTRDELMECLGLIRAIRQGRLDAIEIPLAPLDILAQQIVASVAAEERTEDELYAMCRRAWPYRDLERDQFDRIVTMLSEGFVESTRAGAYLHRDVIGGRLRARRGARMAALTSGGAIPETAEYRVVTEPEGTLVGKVDEDFAIESMAGDVFLLGNTSWRVRQVRQGQVVVHDAEGAPPSIPFWFGEAPGRTVELSSEISRLRRELDVRIQETTDLPESEKTVARRSLVQWLVEQCGATGWAAEQAIDYVTVQHAALGVVPDNDNIVFERFFDESGGMQLVVHSALGARINRAWGLALRKRFCRSFDFELQAAATDNGVLLSIGPQHSFPIKQLFSMLTPENARPILEQALLASPMFQTRWRWNVTRALAVLRMRSGKKVPPHLQRFRSDDLLSAVFPRATGCLENHHGDVPIPDHPLVAQTMHDGLHEAMDFDRWVELLEKVRSGQVRLIPRDTREPSPFCHEILNANPYAFLDDAPLEERRTRAVSRRRGLTAEDVRDLARLDEGAIQQVRSEAWPLVRDADELHDALLSLVVMVESEHVEWSKWFDKLVAGGRATKTLRPNEPPFWIAAELWPLVRAVYPDAVADPPVNLPAHLEKKWEHTDAITKLLGGHAQHTGPFTSIELAKKYALRESMVTATLEALEGQGTVLRGHFTAKDQPQEEIDQWCDRRLLARIHRLTLSGLRERIKPVTPRDFMRFLLRYQNVEPNHQLSGPGGVREVISRMQGFETSAGAWEPSLLASRIEDYDSTWLDHLFMTGEAVWGRLCPRRRDGQEGPSMAMLTRTAPMTLAVRDELAWLLPPMREDAIGQLRSGAEKVLETLDDRGALFFSQLQSITEMMPTHLEESLRELATLGLVTSDSYAAVRAIVGKQAVPRIGRRRSRQTTATAPAGRWSRFPGEVPTVARDEYLDNWCSLLLRRYGVLFRELVTRESAAPAWHELVPVLRRGEMRGTVRGGRFVSDVGGEQYASESAVPELRETRDDGDPGAWTVISAADPLNLTGIIGGGRRVASSYNSALILQNGRCLAARQGRQIEFFGDVEPSVRSEMSRALQLGCKPEPLPVETRSPETNDLLHSRRGPIHPVQSE